MQICTILTDKDVPKRLLARVIERLDRTAFKKTLEEESKKSEARVRDSARFLPSSLFFLREEAEMTFHLNCKGRE